MDSNNNLTKKKIELKKMKSLNENMEVTFLTKEQCVGEDRLDIFRKEESKCEMTDFAQLLGGCYNERLWTKSFSDLNYLVVVESKGKYLIESLPKGRDRGARPVLPYSLIQPICSKVSDEIKENLIVEYGEYPQTVVNKEIAKTLEELFWNKTIVETGKKYVTDSVFINDLNRPFQAREFVEYEYNGKKYIRFACDKNGVGKILSNARYTHILDVYWIEVEPIKWIIDEKNNIALSEKCLFSGIQFDDKFAYEGVFENTNIYKFMNTYFIKDIIPSNLTKKSSLESDTEAFLSGFNAKTEEEKFFILLDKELKVLEEKIDKIINLHQKQYFSDQLINVFNEVESFIKEKRFNEENNKLHLKHIYNVRKNTIFKLWNLNYSINEYLEKEKYLNEIRVLSINLEKANIDLINLTDIENMKIEGIKCVHLLYNEINKKIEKLNEVESDNILEKLIVLSNKFISLINENIKKQESGRMLNLDYEGLSRLITRDFIRFDFIIDEYIVNKENYDRQDLLLNNIGNRLRKR